jgi:hypothetical protein
MVLRRHQVNASVADVLERRGTTRNQHLGGLAIADAEVLGERTLTVVETSPIIEPLPEPRRLSGRRASRLLMPRLIQPIEKRAA